MGAAKNVGPLILLDTQVVIFASGDPNVPLINTKEQIPRRSATNAYRATQQSEHSFQPSLANGLRVRSLCSLQSDMAQAKVKSSVGSV